MKNSSAYAIPQNMRLSAATDFWTQPRQIEKASTGISTTCAAIATLLSSLLLSMVAGWSCMGMVSYAFEGGYDLVAHFCGQPPSQQGVIAAMALWFAVLPASCSFVFGWCKSMLNGSNCWSVFPFVGIAAVTAFAFGADATAEAVVEMAPWVSIAVAFAYAGFFIAQSLAKRTKLNRHAKIAYPVALATFLPAGYCSWIGLPLNYRVELAAITASILLASYFFTRNCAVSQLSKSLKLTALALSPVMVPLLLNVLANAVSLYLDSFGIGLNLGWRALASAQLLLVFATTAFLAGTSLACLRNSLSDKQRLRRSLDNSGNYPSL